MPTMNRSTFIHELLPGLFGVSVDTYDMYNKYMKRWDMLAHVKTSTRDREEKAYRSSLDHLRFKPEGKGVEYDSFIGGPKKTWVMKEYALGTRITENAIEDNLYESFTDFFKDLGG